MLPKYTADCNSFNFYHIQQLASDALVITKDLLQEFTSIELDIRRRFPLYIVNQLLDRTRTFLASQRRTLRKRGRAKLIVLRRKFSRNKFFSRYSDVSVMQRQHNDFLWFHSRVHDFKRFYYCSMPQYCDNNFDNFVDKSLADFEESVNFFNFFGRSAPHVSLNQPFEVLHQGNSRSNNNRHFNKQHRKRSYRRGSHQSGCILRIILLICPVEPTHP